MDWILLAYVDDVVAHEDILKGAHKTYLKSTQDVLEIQSVPIYDD